jgi:hypothetical protein
MTSSIDRWIHRSEEKIASGSGVSLEDLQELSALLKGEQQHLLYIWGAL